ncbi:MAG: sulfur carrier protein ThiS adenylyltransferase ThiF [Sulfurimonas sp.]
MRIGIAGAGGIGSNAAMLLARAGFTKFTMVDFDTLEPSNLNRQFYFEEQLGKPKVEALAVNLKKIYQDLDLRTYDEKLDKEKMKQRFCDCDVIVEGLDQKEYKSMLIEECLAAKKMIVSASGIGGTDLTTIQTKTMADTLHIVGDFETDVSEHQTYAAKVTIVAAVMANIIIQKFGGCS